MRRASAFQQFLSILNEMSGHPSTSITLCHGEDEFLLGLFRDEYRKFWIQRLNQPYVAIELDHLLKDAFVDEFSQGSMFEPAMLYTVYLTSCNVKVVERLAKLAQLKSSNKLLVLMQSKPTTALQKVVKSNPEIYLQHCPSPAPYETVDFIEFQSRQLGLILDTSATKLVSECLGQDLALIANELRRIALYFGMQQTRLNTKQIAPHLGLLKEEMVYRLRNYILEHKLGNAEALLSNLLDRGESGLAILGFLAKHCRSSLIVLESLKNGESQNDITKKSSLQKYLISGYTKYVQKLGHSKLKYALQQCIIADRKFKSERVSQHLLLSEIVQTLC